jgi:MFS family permease
VTTEGLTRRFVLLRALRWLPVGLMLPFLVITPESRGLTLGEIGAVFAVHSAVAIVLEVPSGALADIVGRRRVMLVGAGLTAASLLVFALAQVVLAFMAAVALLAAGRALISGSLEAWYVDSLRSLDPSAPLSRGLSRGTTAEGLAMALGALVAGGLVTLAGPGAGVFSGYGVAALAGALAALAYLAAIAALVHEGGGRGRAPRGGDRRAPDADADLHDAARRRADVFPVRDAAPRPTDAGVSFRERTAEVFTTARVEVASSVVVRVVFLTGVALGVTYTVVELLWQPHLADLLGEADSHGVVFGGLAAASMVAVSVGAGLSEGVNRRLGLRLGYLVALALGAVCIALLGAPQSAAGFAVVYLVAYFGLGMAEPMHYELLNDAVGATARATLISAEALATQAGALVANLSVGALASSHGPALAWVLAGTLLAATTLAVALPLFRTQRRARTAPV